MAAKPAGLPAFVRFGDDFELDVRAYELRSRGIPLKLEPIPMKLLLLLMERHGELVTREQIVERIWGKGVFLDSDNSINSAISKIRQVLREDSEQPRFVQTVTGHGYRFIAPVAVSDSLADEIRDERVPGGTDHPAAATVSVEIERAPTYRRRAILGIAIVALVALGVYVQRGRSHPGSQTSSGRLMLAVLPFENLTGDANQEYFSDGMTEEMITQLGQINPTQLGVIARTSVMLYKHNLKPLDEIGRKLGVQYVIEGSVRRDAGRVRITAQLIRVQDQTHVWAKEYDRDLRNLLGLQGEVAQEIAEEIQITLGERQKVNAARRPAALVPATSYEAYELYLRGMYSLNKETFPDITTSISYFNQAVAKDPGYALAYAGLADAYNSLASSGGTPSEDYPKSNAAARKALELDPTLARAHAVLGSNEIEYNWDFAGGMTEFKKALALDPNGAEIHFGYAYEIGFIGGREQEALAEMNRAHQLDPLSAVITAHIGSIHIWARRYDEAIAVCTKLANEDPTFAGAHLCLVSAYQAKHMYQQAFEEWKTYAKLAGDQSEFEFASALEKVFRSAGWKVALAKSIEMQEEQRKTGYSPAFGIAQLYAEVGEKDQAFRWLNSAYLERDEALVGLKTDYKLDSIRSDPRFAELVRKVGLPQ